jgi:hypothetical protein
LPIGEYSRKLDDFRQPATIIFSLKLNREGHKLLPQANPTMRCDGEAAISTSE